MIMLNEIISGGQTGVDRAALDVAIELGIPHGGWCPKGRLSELGVIPEKYSLTETQTVNYSERTIRNIQDSDGTLVLLPNRTTRIIDGTKLTIEKTCTLTKPLLIVYLTDNIAPEMIVTWLKDNGIKVLNVAGPRESSCPGIYQASKILLREILNKVMDKLK